MKQLVMVLSIFLLVFSLSLPAMGLSVVSQTKQRDTTPLMGGAVCPAELADLYGYAADGLGYNPPPISSVTQVYGILPGKELGPLGVILNFEGSSQWFAKQEPFSEQLKWGFGGWRKEADGSTKLTGLLVPVGGTIADFKTFEGKMSPLKYPLDSVATESGALTIIPSDPNDPNVWIYAYSTYAPNDWNCDQGNFFI